MERIVSILQDEMGSDFERVKHIAIGALHVRAINFHRGQFAAHMWLDDGWWVNRLHSIYILFCSRAIPASEQQHRTFNEWFKASVASNVNQASGR